MYGIIWRQLVVRSKRLIEPGDGGFSNPTREIGRAQKEPLGSLQRPFGSLLLEPLFTELLVT